MPDAGTTTVIWRTIAIAESTLIVSGITAWLWVAQGAVSRSEVMEIVKTQAPYNFERQSIMDRLNKLGADLNAADRQAQDFHTRQVVNEEKIAGLQSDLRETKRELAEHIKKTKPEAGLPALWDRISALFRWARVMPQADG